ncbi:MAG: flippase-like domain-containing protein [Promicromonosporaceae bacterium]|nr:flippase-like domain-containing protein [Promicromonosporaceae bacterium]
MSETERPGVPLSPPSVLPGEATRALRAAVFDDVLPGDASVRVVDNPHPRLRKPRNLLGIVLCVIGITLVLLVAFFAQDTADAITGDISGFGTLLADILALPVGWFENLVTLVLPLAVVIELGLRRLGRQLAESVAAYTAGFLLAVLTEQLITRIGTDYFILSLSTETVSGESLFTVSPFIAALVALLTIAGPRTRRKTVRWAWNLQWAVLLLLLAANVVSLAGILLALLVGRIGGLVVQWLSGVSSERAYGESLVAAVHRAGFNPTALVRVRDLGEASQWDGLQTIHDTVPIKRSDVRAFEQAMFAKEQASPWISDLPPAITPIPADDAHADAVTRSSDSAAVALARSGDNRVYAMLNDDGARYDVVVLDGDRQVVGFMARMWRAIQLRGLEGRANISLKAVAERNALLSYAAAAAGVRTPRLLGLGMADDSAVLVLEHARGAVSLRDLSDADLEGAAGDRIMAEAWKQLLRAHKAGLAHHQLTSDVLLVHRDNANQPRVWIAGWEQGEVAASTLSRRIDLTQLLALLALRVGPQRAVASAVRALPDGEIAAIGPLLQTVALPTDTREEVRSRKGLIGELRAALVERLPEASVEPLKLARFGPRTLIMAVLTIIVVAVVVTTISFEQIREAVMAANPWWVGAALGFAGLTWVGSALTLVAFAPGRVPIRRAIVVQMAGSFVALATPAGIGPAALNLRFLTRKGVPTPMAVATVGLVQVAQITVTITLLIVLSLTTDEGGVVDGPPTEVLVIVGIALAILAILMLMPPVRRWLWAKAGPTLSQVWPRLSEIAGQPTRLALGLAGNLVITLSYVFAFYAALQALGQNLSLVGIATVYLVGNATGALFPTPGGLGAVETTLVLGLTAAGIPGAIALSVTLLFRAITYWARVPIGWVAMRNLEKRNEL